MNGTIEARWWKGRPVILDDRSGNIGGSWQWHDTDGKVLAYDCSLVKFFYEKTLSVENPLVVDVGASTGSFSLLPLLHSSMQVLSFEPNPLAFNVLQSNIQLHNLQNRVQLCQIALMDKRGTDTFRVPILNIHAAVSSLGNPRPRGFEWKEVPVEIMCLDDYDVRPDFIKIDTEGAELMVLQGAEHTIRESMPSLLIEYQELNTRQFGYGPIEIIELLKSWGYTKFTPVGMEDMWISRPS